MSSRSRNSANPLIAKVQQLFSRDLALENDYLRQENKILRNKFGARVPLTESNRRILVKYGLRIKDRLAAVISIAKPDTLLAWNGRQKQKKWTLDHHSATAGRPRKAGDTEALIVRLAQENNSWGYKRISGELKKLGHQACPSYVREVLRRHGLPSAPNRQGLSWKQFLQAHLEVAWATDFLTEEVWTMGGMVTFYILFFLHLGSRHRFGLRAGRLNRTAPGWHSRPGISPGLVFTLSVSDPRPGHQLRGLRWSVKNRRAPHSQNAPSYASVQRARGTPRSGNP